MSRKDPFPDYPARVAFSTERANLFYARVPGYYAVHHETPRSPEPGALFTLEDGTIAVFRGEPGQYAGIRNREDFFTPVYALQPDGSPAVPTGRLLIRFSDETTVQEHRQEIEHAGYHIVEILSYAPQAAWLAPTPTISQRP